MRHFVVCLFTVCFIAVTARPQDQPKPLTNDDVIQMVSLGLSDDVIVEKVKSAVATNFDTSIEGLKLLKQANVSDSLMKAMINPHASAPEAGRSGRVVDEMVTRYKRLQNGVVTVWSEFGHGSGFIISADGLILTNQHVVGPSEYLALQFDPVHKIHAVLLASDPQRDVAVLWCNLAALPGAISLELAKKDELYPSLVEGEKVFTIGSPLNQQKIVTSGIASKIEKSAIISDVNINHGNSGGPLFNSQGEVVGITTFGDFTSRGGPGVSGVLKIEEALPTIEEAKMKMASSKLPSPELLPVEPTDLFPIDAIKTMLLEEKFNAKPYSMGIGDYDVVMITPPLKYRAERESEIKAAKEKGKRNRKSEVAVKDSFRPLDDLKNWEGYVGEYKPVLLIRATPKLRETGGSVFLRALAASGGAYNVPAKMRFKADFYKMKLLCGSNEVMPILPGKIAHVVDVHSGLVNATDATYEGLYEYPADSIGPSCGQVTLTLYGEKDPNKAFTKNLDDKSVTRIFEDFGAYRSQRPEVH
jgi:S1-C subfamily serine protease